MTFVQLFLLSGSGCFAPSPPLSGPTTKKTLFFMCSIIKPFNVYSLFATFIIIPSLHVHISKKRGAHPLCLNRHMSKNLSFFLQVYKYQFIYTQKQSENSHLKKFTFSNQNVSIFLTAPLKRLRNCLYNYLVV